MAFCLLHHYRGLAVLVRSYGFVYVAGLCVRNCRSALARDDVSAAKARITDKEPHPNRLIPTSPILLNCAPAPPSRRVLTAISVR